jgi:quercetin dioxygenase-like cupin family protein
MRRLTHLALFSATIAATALHHPGSALATAAKGFRSSQVAVGRFGEIDALSPFIPPTVAEELRRSDAWLALQKTNASSDVYVQRNTWQAFGSTGWHSHSGKSLIIVTAGKLTTYDGDDPTCMPHVYTKGMAFVDPGGDHAHIIRNESNSVAQAIAIQIISAGTARRIDAADPGNCPF